MRRVELDRWQRYFDHRNKGLGVPEAARRARIDPSTAYRFENGDPTSSGIEAAAVLGVTTVAGALIDLPLSPEARKALDDFAYFRLRYFGRKSLPWQERAAYEILRRHASPDREYVVMNEPPGSGKSTLFTHDIVCWMIARERTIRVMIGSRTERQARMYVGRVKRTLERDAPLKADADSLARGIAHDAAATLSDDFGAFKPEGRSDIWSANSLVVRQLNGMAPDDKEPTLSGWGQDSGFLGGRFDVVVWDDLVDKRNIRTKEAFDALVDWWMTEAETRLEPGGLLLLQGQRMGSDDLYRYCLDMKNLDGQRKYTHVVYPAHDSDRCKGEHDQAAKAWPDGCLLDPHRLPWTMLENIRGTNKRVFEIQYQQNDGDAASMLVEPAWLTGGVDSDGNIAPGCYDSDRDCGDVPRGMPDEDPGWSMVSVDPSPTEYWAVGWWVMRPETNRYNLIDLWRTRMGSERFLSLDLDTMQFSGLLEDIYVSSVKAGHPVTHVVVEVNAAQRYLLTQPHVQRWQSTRGVTFIPHTTYANKADPKFGVTSIADYFRQGAVRLPWGSPATRLRMSDMVHELTRWPEARTDDIVMTTWFALKATTDNYTPARREAPRMARPHWVNTYAGRGLPERRTTDTAQTRMAALATTGGAGADR